MGVIPIGMTNGNAVQSKWRTCPSGLSEPGISGIDWDQTSWLWGAFAASLNWKLSVQANGVNLLKIYGMTAKEAKSWHRTTSISVNELLPMN